MRYSPPEYWARLHERADLSAVGQSGLPPEINRWLYAALARNVRAFLRHRRLDRPPPATSFDVGSGTGFWVEFWHRLGTARVDGCDLVEAAVDRLQQHAVAAGRADQFDVADIATGARLSDRVYPMVGCCNVLLHVTDDDAFDRAARSIAGLVAPAGHLLLVEPILLRDGHEAVYDPTKHSRARSITRYREPLEAAGLELITVEPATVLANNPLEAGSVAALARYQRWWRFVTRRTRTRPASARWIGPLIAVLDVVAMRTGAAPTSKIALFRRPPAGA